LKQPLFALLVKRKLGLGANRAAKRRILFNLLLITFVVSALVFAQMFVVSMSRGIADKYALLGNGHLQVHTTEPVDLSRYRAVIDVQKVGQSYALIYSPSANRMVRLKGVQDSYFSELRKEQLTMGEPYVQSESNLPQILLSTTLAKTLDVQIGDRVALMLVSQSSIRPQLCIVQNLYDSGYQELDANLVFSNYELMARLFQGKEETNYELLVEGDALEQTKRELKAEGYAVTSWDEENYAVATNLNTSRQAVLGVMVAVAILCGYFISELSRELVEDDKYKIAMLTLLGATKRIIRRSYFSTVMVVTLVSVLLGTLLGMAFALNLSPLLSSIAARSIPSLAYYLLDFSIVIPWLDILIITLVLVGVSVISVLFSLRRVARIEPISCAHFD
jgi:lipoprotein-releasing system permease protein